MCGSRDPQLVEVVTGSGAAGAAASPYVIGAVNLGITVFPSVVNAYVLCVCWVCVMLTLCRLLLTSIFSAGNTYTYCGKPDWGGTIALDGADFAQPLATFTVWRLRVEVSTDVYNHP